MKKVYFYVVMLMVVINILKCTDNVSFNVNDINKYPWLVQFTNNFELKDFKGTHNTDLSIINFSFSLNNNQIGSALSKIDSVIIKNEWSVMEASDGKRLIIKEDIENNSTIEMNIELDEKSKCLLFEIK